MATGKNPTDIESKAESNQLEEEDKAGTVSNKVKFVVFGQEMLEKQVKLSGNSGRVYLPPDWVGHRVKIIRID